MKKIVRWALAFAAVTSVPASAMALCAADIQDVGVINGPGGPSRVVGIGSWRLHLDQLVFGLYDDSCAYFVNWVNTAGLASNTKAFVEQVNGVGSVDCEFNSYYPAPGAMVRLSTQPDYMGKSFGYDKFQQKRNICNMTLTEGIDGSLMGMIQYHPTSLPYGMMVKPRNGCSTP